MIQTINKGKTNTQMNSLQQKILAQMRSLAKNKNQENHHSLANMNKEEQMEAEQLFGSTEAKEIVKQDQSGSQENSSAKNEEQSQNSQQNEEENEDNQANQIDKMQDKVISILRKNYTPSNNKKQVTFDIKEEDKKKLASKQDYIIIQGTRKWNEKLKNPRKGKLDPQEKRTLIQSLSQCLNIQNMSLEEVVKAMSEEDDEKIPRNLHFWTKVCSVLPNRTLVSSYKFLKRELNTKNKRGEWNQEEVDQLLELVQKYGRKWSKIAKQMHRTSENVRDKFRLIGEQKYDPSNQQTVWKFEQLVQFLKYIQKYSGIEFLDEKIQQQIQNSSKYDQIELKQMKQKKYNSKSFKFHNNEIVLKYISPQFKQIKIDSIRWQKISDKIGTKTIYDCRNKFVQILQLQICGADSKQHYEKEIVKFIHNQKVKQESQINWSKWKSQNINSQQVKNRWMILKRHIQGRGQKTFTDLLEQMVQKFGIK